VFDGPPAAAPAGCPPLAVLSRGARAADGGG
jgi:hypothetical protein